MEQVKAKWIKISGTHAGDKPVLYKCSSCGFKAEWKRGMKGLYPSDYCPKCNADMVALRTACLD